MQLTKPKRGEALRRGQRWLVRAKGASLAPQLGTPPPAAPVLLGAAKLRRWSQSGCPGRALPQHGSPAALPSSRAPAASGPSALALQGCSPHHWAQQSAGWSSFQSCHFFFISDFTCRGGEGESGGFSLAVPSPQTERGGGWQSHRPRQGRAPAPGGEAAAGMYLLVGEAVEHGHQEPLEGERASEPPAPPPLPGLGWA